MTCINRNTSVGVKCELFEDCLTIKSGGGLVLIQTSLFLSCKSSCSVTNFPSRATPKFVQIFFMWNFFSILFSSWDFGFLG